MPSVLGERQSILVVDPHAHTVRVDGKLTRLTRTQFRLLTCLAKTTGEWLKTSDLISDALGTHHRPNTSLIRVHVHALRQRLGARATWLESDPARVRGYRWLGPKL